MSEEDYERVVRSYPLMRISLHYCEPLQKASLVAMYNLLLRLEECITRISDPAISRAKLSWWYEELSQARTRKGNHPVTLGLQDCGALNCWSASLVDSLFKLTLDRVDAAGLNDERSLQVLCEAVGSMHFQLESSLFGEHPAELPERLPGAVTNGFMHILRESYLAKLPSFYWVPLTYVAQSGLVRSSITSDRNGAESRQMLVNMLDRLLVNNSIEHSSSGSPRMAAPVVVKSRHWLILSALQLRRLKKLKKKLEATEFFDDIALQLQAISLGDGWIAWHTARRFKAAPIEVKP